MKKSILISLVLLLMAGAVFGQVTVGVKGGVPISFATGSDWEESLDTYINENRLIIGYSFGTFFSYGFGYGLAVQPEVHFSKWGYGVTDSDKEDFDYLEGTVDVIEVPIFVKYSLPMGHGLFSILAGPQITTLLGDFNLKGVSIDGSESEYTLIANNALWVGTAIGIGYNFPAGHGFVTFDTRYILNFTGFRYIEDTIENMIINNIGIRLGYGMRL